MTFVAGFLGRRLAYTHEFLELVPGARVVMMEGPFPMETTQCWEDTASGATRMTLRYRGEPWGFAKVAPAGAGAGHATANTKDLAPLEQILEH